MDEVALALGGDLKGAGTLFRVPLRRKGECRKEPRHESMVHALHSRKPLLLLRANQAKSAL